MNLFRAPASARAAKTLDRSLFVRKLPTAAASVCDNRLIAKYRQQLGATRELLALDRLSTVAADPDPALAAQGRKCLILKPGIVPSGARSGPCGSSQADVCFSFSPRDLESGSAGGFQGWGLDCRSVGCIHWLRDVELSYVNARPLMAPDGQRRQDPDLA